MRGKTDLLRKNTKKIYKAEIEKQTCRGAAGNELNHMRDVSKITGDKLKKSVHLENGKKGGLS
jgi:hypothetical protein